MNAVTVVGAGLAGSEAAYQLAIRGIPVRLIEMKPKKMTPAHVSPYFAELVCSNSLRSDELTNAVGLLKEELRRLGSIVMRCADEHRVAAGGALAVDREGFARAVTEAVRALPNVEIVEEEAVSGSSPVVIADKLYEFTKQLIVEDEDANRKMGEFGAALLEERSSVLTHCNAGSLATAFFGTALGVIYEAALQGKIEMVYADETRPLRQGARLTAFELAKAQVPVTLICDDMAATTMAQGRVDAVFVGADRIAANGDTANKVGTLGVAIAAARYGIPFYVVAPTSTIDVSAQHGEDIPIEKRAASEVLDPPIPGVKVYNPAFDVTPADLITAIITEEGVVAPADIISVVM